MLDGISAVIFDLDGTLVDSMWMWRQIDIDYLEMKSRAFPEDLQSCIEGMSFSETAEYFKERFGLEDSIEEIKAEWNRMAHDMYEHRVPFKPGAKDFLQRLKQQGIGIGIATSNSKELVETVMKALEAEELFDEIHTACEVSRGKPAPDIYLHVAKCLGANPEGCLVFEDIVNGILAGKAAGMKVCAVYDDFSADQDGEKRRLSDYYINSYEEIL